MLEKTQRGFNVYGKLTDVHNSEISVTQSSDAIKDTIWIHCDNKKFKQLSPCLNKQQVKQLIEFLQAALEHMEEDHSCHSCGGLGIIRPHLDGAECTKCKGSGELYVENF